MLGNKNDGKVTEEMKSKVETILGNGTKIEGDLFTKGSLRVEGEVIGNIKAEGDLFVGEKGKLKTEIDARNVIIAGTVNGNIVAREKLEILPSGQLNGDIKTKKLKIEEGAVFIGSSSPLNGKSDNDKYKKEAASTRKK
ncbi:bactofilin family protein [Halothermothrix orenii]|uniref:Integral membrane protein CcmA involved in cell shape determination n=1 Tax=Halothermothrix orenii (strain H 168 / OCM 544 / DSM 9562) TaxID=373903 RepID=B8D1E0_HALOH|nr:polymer-forming cytoskeletal protein [Halothermothrix orenii]ACL71092.1 Integral membrane protein CcmA involved in cell shape determination [Halothermothrix orenii H 168]